MNRYQARLALLKYSLITLAVLSSFLLVSVWNTRPANSPPMVPTVVDVVTKAGTAVARVPAAIPGLLIEKPKAAVRPGFEVWQSPCLSSSSKLKPMATSSGWLRVSSDTCNSKTKVKDTKLINDTNGYVATVFNTSPSHLTTDFIPLATGQNVLKMELLLDSGETLSYSWTVDRAPTATN